MTDSDTIIKISDIDNFIHEDDGWIGVEIKTSQQVIKVLIADFQSCCEKYDVLLMTPNNNKEELIGAEIKSVKWGRDITKNYTEDILDNHGISIDTMDINYAIVDIETDRGLIQVIAYNEHNGFYPHRVHVEWKDYTDTQEI